MNNNVLYIAFSAFFADLGYQTAIAIFPIFLVMILGASASTYGIASAIAFGIGSFFGYIGGIMSDRYDSRYVAILGNALIPLISLMALTQGVWIAVFLFSGGWWARNFRSPARRSLLVEHASKDRRGQVFGFLHALDIGGGMLSVVMLLFLLYVGLSLNSILLITAIPLVISTLLLLFTKHSRAGVGVKAPAATNSTYMSSSAVSRNTYVGIIIATALYGFSTYSLGFPILTIAQQTKSDFIGIASYAVYLGVSALVGYWIGSSRYNRIKSLAYLGYMLSGAGSLLLGISYLYNYGYALSYMAVALMGFAFGVIETVEPTMVSSIKRLKDMGRGMGTLSGSRSFGIFLANLIMGILYVLSPFYSYLYATIMAVAAGVIVLAAGRGFKE
jgi:hypothetical protein